MNYISYIKDQILSLSEKQINNTVNLLLDDATIPFISRYRKEQTGNLDEVQIFTISKLYHKYLEIEKRKDTILEAIKSEDKLTPELNEKIKNSFDLNELEDIYFPYKKKRKTKADASRELGLEPLAKIIMKQNNLDNLTSIANKYINNELKNAEEVLENTKYIIAEWINENSIVRNKLRETYNTYARIISSLIKKEKDNEKATKFSNYFEFNEKLINSPSHRILAMIRGENEGILKLKIEVEEERIYPFLERLFIKSTSKEIVNYIQSCIKYAFSKLLEPSLSNEALKVAKQKADKVAINVFSSNLRQLLLSPPLGEKRILAIDPRYKSGCKLVCLDELGNLLHNDIIYPHPPLNKTTDSIKKIKSLVNAYKIEAISIGNGTASRETEKLIRNIKFDTDITAFVISEAGASVYSASSIAREEFPSYDVTVRGAVSIGRRLSDPLAELVKIEPKSIGVGQYQHDVDQNMLKEELDNTVISCVNTIGVNLNTASKYLLSYISGITPSIADNIIDYRTNNGAFKSREDLKKVPRLGDKAFQQASAFLKISNAHNPLDNSSVHPESYFIVEKIGKDLNTSIQELIKNNKLIDSIQIDNYISDSVGKETLTDIIKELKLPGLDPRKMSKVFSFDTKIKSINDLKEGYILAGIINNITNFGCFVDIGIKENGLIHISQISKEYISDITEKVSLNQEVNVKIIGVDLTNKKIQLSMILD